MQYSLVKPVLVLSVIILLNKLIQLSLMTGNSHNILLLLTEAENWSKCVLHTNLTNVDKADVFLGQAACNKVDWLADWLIDWLIY